MPSSHLTEEEPIPQPQPSPTWAYPTRFCRICREDVPATVTFYPPGLPPVFQRPVVEYKNEDEYGRLLKPCNCRGGMRYIHELCLLRSRTENNRAGSMWKCHECGYQFNFQRLALQRYLSSGLASGLLTIWVMLVIMFILGFIADPIINLYVDPYSSLLGDEKIWSKIEVQATPSSNLPGWSQHFLKGLVSMGLVGFMKVILLNPLNWLNFRNAGIIGSNRGTSSTGRDRAANISWIAVVIGVSSAFYFFYQWVQKIIQKTLQRIGNNIVNTQLPGDDDDLKPPPGWNAQEAYGVPADQGGDRHGHPVYETQGDPDVIDAQGWDLVDRLDTSQLASREHPAAPLAEKLEMSTASPANAEAHDLPHARSSAVQHAHEQAWSFPRMRPS